MVEEIPQNHARPADAHDAGTGENLAVAIAPDQPPAYSNTRMYIGSAPAPPFDTTGGAAGIATNGGDSAAATRAPSSKQREDRMTQQVTPPELDWGNTRHLWFSITEIDYTNLIRKVNFKELLSLFAAPIELLDIGSGSGRFPSILHQHLATDYCINYDYLDPWEDKLVETEQALNGLYTLRKRLCTSVESLDPANCPADGYDLLWSMHSFYYVERDSLSDTLKKLRNLVKMREGIALIYLSSKDAFYNQFYELYLRQTGINGYLFVCAEEIVRALDSIGIESTILTVDTQHTIPLCDEPLLERYIQGCAMKTDAYQNVKSDKLLTDFIDSFKGPSHYQFPQSLKLIAFGSAKKLASITVN